MGRTRVNDGIPLDAEKTLYETRSREVWQSTLLTAEGTAVGPVIRQIIEPDMYTIRYFIVYDLQRSRHILIPSNTVVDITEDRVVCTLQDRDVATMPPFEREVSRPYEEEVYQAARRTPHWIEEQTAARSTEADD